MNDMSEPQAKKKMDTADIIRVLKYLPHRYPFLMLDRIYDMDGDQSCVGLKNVTINEPFFQGHFPQFPVMPGVLIIEGLAQTAGALCVHSLGQDYKAELVYFMAIDRAKFRKPVLPGDQNSLSREEDPQPRPRVALLRRGQGRRQNGCRGRGECHASRQRRRPGIRGRQAWVR